VTQPTDPGDNAALLAAYDEQLRTDAETPSAISVTRLGPLRLVTFAGGRGFVTYPRLHGVDAETLRDWVARALDHYRADDAIDRVEWKTRGHDDAPGLHEALLDHGFEPQEPESIMLGEARLLAVEVPLPDGVSLRTVTDEADVLAMCVMQDEAFGDSAAERFAESLLRRLALRDGMELWVAEAEGEMVAAGRLEPVAGTQFAGLWGGATLPSWRGRGIYRALTAARARSALDAGFTLVNSDSTAFSRPILERSGLVAVSTTTPYHWRAGS
jgi:ribosomal protein S18 acetylase RimI-like enzyme